MLAQALVAALALVSAGTPHRTPTSSGHRAPRPPAGEPPITPQDLAAQNAFRARRGLLPRKARPAGAPAKKRLVLRAPAPVWLGEPGLADDVAVAAAPAPSLAVPEEITDPTAVRAALAGASVEVLVVRHRADGEGPLVEATVEGALVEAVILRRNEPR